VKKFTNFLNHSRGFYFKEISQMRTSSIKRARGQGMTEYIIIVALIAIAAIGVYSMFGNIVKAQTGAMAAELAGDHANAKTAMDKSTSVSTANAKKATVVKELKDFGSNNDIK
jgi:type IV pilus assembly protein PilA